jgi:hypothetical protein
VITVGAAVTAALARAARQFSAAVSLAFPAGTQVVSGWVASMDVDRSLASDLPEGVRLVQGFASAEATVVLGGRDYARTLDQDTPGWLLAPHSTTSPLYRTARLRAPVTCDVNVWTDDGVSAVRRFTGTVRSITTQARDRTVTVVGTDTSDVKVGAELPVVVADELIDGEDVRPGLNAQWVVDYLLRQAGVYASPPPRATAVLSATLHGSMYPEVGGHGTSAALTRAYATVSGVRTAPSFSQGQFGLAPDAGAYADYVLLSDLDTGSSANTQFLIEFWVKAPASWTASTVFSLLDSGVTDEELDVSFTAAGQVQVTYYRVVPTGVTIAGPTIPADSAWHYLGLYVEFTSATAYRVTFNRDGTVTGPTSGVIASALNPSLTAARITGTGPRIEALQVDKKPAVLTWNSGWTPRAVLNPSLLELRATPIVDSAANAWDILREIAGAEMAMVGRLEDGTFVYRNRRWWPSTVARTVTTDDLLALAITETTDSVVNRVRVPYSPLTLQPSAVIWQAAEKIIVPAFSTKRVEATFESTVLGLPSSLSVLPLGGGVSGYRGSVQADGSGGAVTNLSITVTPVGTTGARLTIFNPNWFPTWLVSPAGAGYPPDSDGQPTLVLAGRAISEATASDTGNSSSTASAAEASNAASITDEGERLLELGATQWRQNVEDAAAVAQDLLADLYEGRPELSEVTIRADPRLQLGDLVVVVDTAGLRLSEPGWVTDIRETWSPGGATMAIRVRLVASPGQWILGYSGRSELGSTTNL